MIHLVELRYIAGEPDGLTAEMQVWLDRRRIAAEEIAYSAGCPGLAFRVAFRNEGDAAAFADAFGGRLAAADPRGANHWRPPPQERG